MARCLLREAKPIQFYTLPPRYCYGNITDWSYVMLGRVAHYCHDIAGAEYSDFSTAYQCAIAVIFVYFVAAEKLSGL
ncbi:MAG: hypothetical protein ACI8PP_001344 [Candidatus Pseudothioglobus sp.]|jgi:hypothetical protein